MCEILTFNLIEYLAESHEFVAEYCGERVLVDPFVGCAWGDMRRDLGEKTFEGQWYVGKYRVFLPIKEVGSGRV